MRFLFSTVALFLCIALVYAADLKYIMAFKSTATKETFAKARKDIKDQGGKVTYEFHSAMNGIEFTFPNEQVSALREKAYVDFIEQDKTVHTFE